MTNASKAIVWDRQQEPFGEDHAISGSGSTTLRFPGQLADNESDLNYNYFRDYDPTLGKYIEADPIGLNGMSLANVNLYGYVGGNPMRYMDPFGLWPQYPWGGDMLPETKKQLEKNLPIIFQNIAPDITPGEAKQLANDTIQECGVQDYDIGSSLKGMTNPNQLSAEQKKAIGDFLNRLPEQDSEAIEKLKKALGI